MLLKNQTKSLFGRPTKIMAARRKDFGVIDAGD